MYFTATTNTVPYKNTSQLIRKSVYNSRTQSNFHKHHLYVPITVILACEHADFLFSNFSLWSVLTTEQFDSYKNKQSLPLHSFCRSASVFRLLHFGQDSGQELGVGGKLRWMVGLVRSARICSMIRSYL